MQIATRFDIGDKVRVVKDGGFVCEVEAVSVSVKADETVIGYTVRLPPERRTGGRHPMDTWGYREDWLEAAE